MCKGTSHGEQSRVNLYRKEHWHIVNTDEVFKSRSKVPVDKCIAPIVQALNSAGIQTLGSCCGHGVIGYIALDTCYSNAMGHYLFITPSSSKSDLYRKAVAVLERAGLFQVP